MPRKTGILIRGLMVSAFALAAGAAGAQESSDPIKLTLHDWTGQLITTNLMGEVLKQAGYNVEYVQADYLAQFAGLERATCMWRWRCGRRRGATRWMHPPPPARPRSSARPA